MAAFFVGGYNLRGILITVKQVLFHESSIQQ